MGLAEPTNGPRVLASLSPPQSPDASLLTQQGQPWTTGRDLGLHREQGSEGSICC